MRRTLQYAMFISLFFLGFLVLNYYVFLGMSFLLGLPTDTGFYIVMIIAAISYPLATLIERTVSNNITRIFYTAASAWMGISFYLLFLLIIYLKILSTIFIKIILLETSMPIDTQVIRWKMKILILLILVNLK